MPRIDLFALYNNVFVGIPYRRLDSKHIIQQADDFTIEGPDQTPSPAVGVLGVPIALPCDLDGERLPNEPLIDITGEKLIVKTQIDGQDGTFKELYSTGDWQVTIRGICVDEENPDEYPEDQVRAIRNIIEVKQHIKVVNRLTALFNIEYLAIEQYSFPAVPGELGMQGYELRCVSDKEFPLRLRIR